MKGKEKYFSSYSLLVETSDLLKQKEDSFGASTRRIQLIGYVETKIGVDLSLRL